MSRRWAGGSTRAWRKIRAYVLDRDDYRCRLQLPDVCTGVADTVHHTEDRALVGDDPDYLQAACAACNQARGDPTKRTTRDPAGRGVTRW